MMSAVMKNKRKSQREAARLQKQAEADLAMEEDEEIHFNRPETTPDTPRVSRNNTPDPEDDNQGETDYTVVLEMVKNVRDKLAALILDNTNIRAACDDLRRQCQLFIRTIHLSPHTVGFQPLIWSSDNQFSYQPGWLILRSAPPAANLQNRPLYRSEEGQQVQTSRRWTTTWNSFQLAKRKK